MLNDPGGIQMFVPVREQWTLTSGQLIGLLDHAGIEPQSGSPWMHLGAAPTPAEPLEPIDPTAKLGEALARVARPDLVVATAHCRPELAAVSWYYGNQGDDLLVCHEEERGQAHHIAWPIPAAQLVAALSAAIALDAPSVTAGFALVLDRSGFETVAAIIDAMQEASLRGALDREPPAKPGFDALSLMRCIERSLQRMDPRRMMQKALMLSPVRLQPTIDGLHRGLQLLAGQGMITWRGDRLTATDRFHTFCSLLASTGGCCTLATRRRVEQEDGSTCWNSQHVGAIRGTGSLWLLEFSDVTESDFVLKLCDVPANILRWRLQAGLPEADVDSEPGYIEAQVVAPAAAAPPSLPPRRRAPVPAQFCISCGGPVNPRHAFCERCGKPIERSRHV